MKKVCLKIKCSPVFGLVSSELDPLEVPPLTPTSKEVLSQAVNATFQGFAQERNDRHFPQGTVGIHPTPPFTWTERGEKKNVQNDQEVSFCVSLIVITTIIIFCCPRL